MSTLDKNYFYGPLKIPAVDTDGSIERNLKIFIAMYEEQFLRLLLGDALYEAYKTGMALPEVDQEQKWKDLDAQLYIKIGTGEDTTYLSPAANYVYWFYMRNEVTNTTASGEKISMSENSIPVGSAQKVKLAWNSMVERNRRIQYWIALRPGDYPQWLEPVWTGASASAIQNYKDRNNILRTLIHFF